MLLLLNHIIVKQSKDYLYCSAFRALTSKTNSVLVIMSLVLVFSYNILLFEKLSLQNDGYVPSLDIRVKHTFELL